jgi:hypothetical protein
MKPRALLNKKACSKRNLVFSSEKMKKNSKWGEFQNTEYLPRSFKTQPKQKLCSAMCLLQNLEHIFTHAEQLHG